MKDSIVDENVGAGLRVAGSEVEALSCDVAAVRGGLDVRIGAVPHDLSSDRHLEADIEKDREVEVISKLGALQEDTVKEQDGVPRSLWNRVCARQFNGTSTIPTGGGKCSM